MKSNFHCLFQKEVRQTMKVSHSSLTRLVYGYRLVIDSGWSMINEYIYSWTMIKDCVGDQWFKTSFLAKVKDYMVGPWLKTARLFNDSKLGDQQFSH